MIWLRRFLLLVLACWSGAEISAQELHLKVRRIPSPGEIPELRRRHILVQFDHPPNSQDFAALAKSGMRVLAAVPDNSVMVLVTEGFVPGSGVRWAGALQIEEKLSKELSEDGWNAVVVEFHPDVLPEAQDLTGAAEGLVFLRAAGMKSTHVLAFGSYPDLHALASHDEVAYIFPASSQLGVNSQMRACAGMLTQAGPVAQYSNIVHGWDVGSDQFVHLNYIWGELTSKVPAAQVKSEVLRAWSEWIKRTNITLQEGTDANSPKSIMIRFVAGVHGDSYPFDGPGGVLAHTFYPVPVNPEPIAGDMHLDADENWHVGGDIDIFSVALHETGHALGLGHSDKPGDVMYPYYRNSAQLSAGDIGAIQQLYGVPIAAGTPPPPDPVLPTPPNPPNPPTGPTPPAAPVSVTLTGVPAKSTEPVIGITGMLTGGTFPATISWQTDKGASGSLTKLAAGSWSIAGVPLLPGSNTVTVNAMDNTHSSSSASAAVTYSPPVAPTPTSGGQKLPVTVSIQSPASSTITTTAATISLSGTASGGSGSLTVNWQSSIGLSGIASGNSSWMASNVPLYTGTNTLIVKAIDSSGTSAWTTIVITKR